MKLIIAQGNPGEQYKKNRHNIGFLVLDSFASKLGLDWMIKTKFNARIAEFSVDGEKIFLAKPEAFYNETGLSTRKLVDFYDLNVKSDVLVVHDDLALPFGTVRTRKQGSDAGNNGVKSLNQHIGPDYHRLRIGIWNELRDRMNDSDFVLGNFSKDESVQLTEKIIPHAIEVIDKFCNKDIEITSKKL